jgi:Stress responsive A/B Barrel Domain
MSRTKIFTILGAMLAVVAVTLTGPMGIGATKTAAGPKLAHMVYFKLKDGSGGNRAKLVASCKLLLSGHEGVEYFSTGSLAGDLTKDFNDRDFDVSLNLVFAGKEAHDKYQESDRHKKFIEENIESIEKVRVFDSYLSPAPPAKGAPSAESAN